MAVDLLFRFILLVVVFVGDPKYIGPDYNSDRICYRVRLKRYRVRVDIRVRLTKIGPDYPETGKHPIFLLSETWPRLLERWLILNHNG